MIVYRNTDAWGSGKGAKLTSLEVDFNFYDHELRIVALETNPPDANSISDITVSGALMTIVMDDATEFGPFTLPTATFTDKGIWAPSTIYIANDMVQVDGFGLYLVLQDHTSALTFDPDVELNNEPVYNILFPTLAKPTPTQTKTVAAATYDIVLSDSESYIRCTHPAGCDVTVPADSNVNHAVDTEIHFRQSSDAPVIFLSDVGVAINGIVGHLNETSGSGAVVTLKKVSSNSWDLFGRLAEDVTT